MGFPIVDLTPSRDDFEEVKMLLTQVVGVIEGLEERIARLERRTQPWRNPDDYSD